MPHYGVAFAEIYSVFDHHRSDKLLAMYPEVTVPVDQKSVGYFEGHHFGVHFRIAKHKRRRDSEINRSPVIVLQSLCSNVNAFFPTNRSFSICVWRSISSKIAVTSASVYS